MVIKSAEFAFPSLSRVRCAIKEQWNGAETVQLITHWSRLAPLHFCDLNRAHHATEHPDAPTTRPALDHCHMAAAQTKIFRRLGRDG